MLGSLLCELIRPSQDPDKEGASHFKDEEMRHREGKQLVQGYTASKWKSWGLNPGCLTLASTLVTIFIS